MTPVAHNVSIRSLITFLFGVAMAVTLVFGASEAQASAINLVGVNGSGVTATVSNYSLVGNVFTFDLTNTSVVGFTTSISMSVGDIVEATGFLTTAPFTYTLIHNGATPPDGPNLRATDFFLAPASQVTGIFPGQTFTYSFTGMTMDNGLPLSGITADLLAGGITVRLRGLQTPSGTDIAAAVPEPTSFMLLAGGLGVLAARRRLKNHA